MSHRLFAQLAFERALGNAAIEALATGWGSAVGSLPQLPHARRSGSHWQGARELVLRMTAGIVERRAQAADALAAALAPDQD